MPDVVDSATRSRMMSGIRSTNTQPEIVLRKALHRMGFRYTLHAKNILGKPDMAFPSLRAAIFVNGCFWHGHDCRFFRLPQTRPEFWCAKIERNRARDQVVRERLALEGWRHLTVWECAVRGAGKDAPVKVAAKIAKWLRSRSQLAEIRGP
ncbi:very short patch repair endonuclease [Bradyrhizobium sp. LA7.1]|uniref:very short patch repair endonuclease n=1 Tax=Bradyrhizobium sp. LA7.1 TaxID=3156324 RepID=UPI003397FDC9